jgi:hypothetical protein
MGAPLFHVLSSAGWRADSVSAKVILGSRLSCAIRAKTITAQNGPAGRRLEWHRVGLATLITGDLKSLALATRSFGTPKVRTARIPARLAAFRMSQVAFVIVLLFAFGKRKRVSTFRASDLDVWHIAVSPMRGLRCPTLFALRGARSSFRFTGCLSERIKSALTLRFCHYGACVRNG